MSQKIRQWWKDSCLSSGRECILIRVTSGPVGCRNRCYLLTHCCSFHLLPVSPFPIIHPSSPLLSCQTLSFPFASFLLISVQGSFPLLKVSRWHWCSLFIGAIPQWTAYMTWQPLEYSHTCMHTWFRHTLTHKGRQTQTHTQGQKEQIRWMISDILYVVRRRSLVNIKRLVERTEWPFFVHPLCYQCCQPPSIVIEFPDSCATHD